MLGGGSIVVSHRPHGIKLYRIANAPNSCCIICSCVARAARRWRRACADAVEFLTRTTRPSCELCHLTTSPGTIHRLTKLALYLTKSTARGLAVPFMPRGCDVRRSAAHVRPLSDESSVKRRLRYLMALAGLQIRTVRNASVIVLVCSASRRSAPSGR